MLGFFRSGTDASVPSSDPSVVTAEIAVPLEQTAPAEQRGWVDHLQGAAESTWRNSSALGAKVASDAVSVAGSALTTAGTAATRIGGYGLDAAGLAVTHAGTAAKSVGSAAGSVGTYGLEAAEVAGRAVVEAGRFGGAAVTRVGEGAGWAASGVGRIGTGIIDGIVVTPATAATRSAAMVANAAIVQPAKAVKSFVLTVLFTLCGTAAFVAACAAAAMFFYNGGLGHGGGVPVAVASPAQPMIIVLPQQQSPPQPPVPVAAPSQVLPAQVQPAPTPSPTVVPTFQRAFMEVPAIAAPAAPTLAPLAETPIAKAKPRQEAVAPKPRKATKVAEPAEPQ